MPFLTHYLHHHLHITRALTLTSLFAAAVREHGVGSLVGFGSDTAIRQKASSHHALDLLVAGGDGRAWVRGRDGLGMVVFVFGGLDSLSFE